LVTIDFHKWLKLMVVVDFIYWLPNIHIFLLLRAKYDRASGFDETAAIENSHGFLVICVFFMTCNLFWLIWYSRGRSLCILLEDFFEALIKLFLVFILKAISIIVVLLIFVIAYNGNDMGALISSRTIMYSL
jgi:hypothetical protein